MSIQRDLWISALLMAILFAARADGQNATADTYRARGDLLLQHGDVRGAVAAYRSAVVAGKDEPKNYYALALALDRAGSFAEERIVLHRVVQLNNSFAPAYNQLGLLSLREKKASEARSELNQALTLNPGYAEATNNLGVLNQQDGDTSAAEQDFREAISEDARFVQAMVNLGSLLMGISRRSC